MPAVVVSAVVGATVVGSAVVGATVVGVVVGANVVGATKLSSIQSIYVLTLAYTPGRSFLAQPYPQDTIPTSFPLQIKGPPLSP